MKKITIIAVIMVAIVSFSCKQEDIVPNNSNTIIDISTDSITTNNGVYHIKNLNRSLWVLKGWYSLRGDSVILIETFAQMIGQAQHTGYIIDYTTDTMFVGGKAGTYYATLDFERDNQNTIAYQSIDSLFTSWPRGHSQGLQNYEILYASSDSLVIKHDKPSSKPNTIEIYINRSDLLKSN